MTELDRQAAFTGTKDVALPLKVDVGALEAYLARQVAGFAGPLRVRQFKGGQSNPTYLLETPARLIECIGADHQSSVHPFERLGK